ncbi:TetR/AcrR family transcriptional regulator [Hoeflea sp. TYP-13]|uniref:TetR/AcrR family transcriptional regulator n=1 Tax=Hoeflea sp. TYP-13 TaxID=3230023 RepID=UPI0034C609CA
MARGRPRKTDPDAALDTAMKVFWERGFEGTSMNDLSTMTGMAKPGLYANFGDKEAIYAKAMERYCSAYAGPMLEDLLRSDDSLEITVRRFLDGVVVSATDTMGPKGCFVANNLVECAGKPPSLEALGRYVDEQRQKALAARFQAARQKGELPEDADIKSLAEFYSGQALALAVMARAGAPWTTLYRFVDTAMTLLPAVEAEETGGEKPEIRSEWHEGIIPLTPYKRSVAPGRRPVVYFKAK